MLFFAIPFALECYTPLLQGCLRSANLKNLSPSQGDDSRPPRTPLIKCVNHCSLCQSKFPLHGLPKEHDLKHEWLHFILTTIYDNNKSKMYDKALAALLSNFGSIKAEYIMLNEYETEFMY